MGGGCIRPRTRHSPKRGAVFDISLARFFLFDKKFIRATKGYLIANFLEGLNFSNFQSKVTIVSKDSCLAVYDPISKNFISDKQICAGTEKSDSCSGDSGGPMLSNKFGPFAVVGITSFGVKCKDPTFPGEKLTMHL
jgi:hypothetical protein